MLDISQTTKSKSDQLNTCDLVGLDQFMVQVEGVQMVNDPQQPVHIYYFGCEGKPFKPCLTVRRILVALWGKDGNEWAGKWMNLYVDPAVSFGKQKNIGGIRVNAVSHIPSTATLALSVRRGVKQQFTIQPINLEGQQ